MCTRQDHQTTVFSVDFLHGRPRADNSVGRSEREVVQILMHGMPRCLLALKLKYVYYAEYHTGMYQSLLQMVLRYTSLFPSVIFYFYLMRLRYYYTDISLLWGKYTRMFVPRFPGIPEMLYFLTTYKCSSYIEEHMLSAVALIVKNWMLIFVLLCENECQRWDASRYIKARSEAQRFYVYRDASHLWHSFSHNRTKINIQNL